MPATSTDRRLPRRVAPLPPLTRVALPAPPSIPDPNAQSSIAQSVMMTAGMAGGMIFLIINPKPLFVFAGVLFLCGALGVGVVWAVQQRLRGRRGVRAARERYLEQLDVLRAQAIDAARAQHDRAWSVHPPAHALAAVAISDRVFERRREDDDFLDLRLGTGTAEATTQLTLPATLDFGAGTTDSVCAGLAADLAATARSIPGMPLVLPARTLRLVMLHGDQDALDNFTGCLLAQAATWHSPADLATLVACAPGRAASWDWVKWLPHHAAWPAVLTDPAEVEDRLTRHILARQRSSYDRPRAAGGAASPHLLAVLDGVTLRADGALAALAQPGATDVTVLVVRRDQPPPRWYDATVRVERSGTLTVHHRTADALAEDEHLEHDAPAIRETGRREPAASGPDVAMVNSDLAVTGSADRLDCVSAATLARHVAAANRAPCTGQGAGTEHRDLFDLLGIDPALAADRERVWAPRTREDLLAVRFGADHDGEPVTLDIKEAAAGGMGPHGIIIGATGSGKSELLRTLVTGLALTHPPETLSLVLTDFKGGAAFHGLDTLPHLAGMITNLAEDEALVERMYQALYGELARRQEFLRAAGGLPSVAAYQDRRRTEPTLEPLPYLVVVVDEFSELLVARPDFADLFAAIGRLGRSLGMHLVLASQRLDEGRIRGLESHLSYRIALRTFSTQDSMTVIGVPDAHRLPQQPGWGYLKVASDPPRRFRATSVSGPHRSNPAAGDTPIMRLQQFTATAMSTSDTLPPRTRVPAGREEPPGDELSPPATILALAVAMLRADQRRTHQIWLPPLPAELALSTVTGPLRHSHGSLTVAIEGAVDGNTDGSTGGRALPVPIGVVDMPRQQSYGALRLNFAGEQGNVAVCGGPQTGKTTTIATLLLSLCLHYPPDRVRVYCLDYSGRLHPFARFPHVGAVVPRSDRELLTLTVSRVLALIGEREHQARQDPAATTAWPHVFLCVDSITDLRGETDEVQAALAQIVQRGLAFDVHVVGSAARWADIRPAMRDAIGARIELRLGDPADSLVDRTAARTLPAGVPGRALVIGGLHTQIALPVLYQENPPEPATLLPAPVLAELSDQAWHGERATEIKTLPAELSFALLPEPGQDPRPGVPVGIEQHQQCPVYLDLTGHETHLLVLGDKKAGKTNLLRVTLAGLMARAHPDNVRIAVIDYRRGLLEDVEPPFLHGYAASAPAAAELVGGMVALLAERMPGTELTAAELRSRSWWHGPELYLVVDDYDLVSSGLGDPLQPLVDLLPLARDIGLHLLIARRTSGVSRALLMPLLQRLNDFGASTVLLSGDPSEGPIVAGIRPQPQPTGRGMLVRDRDTVELIQTALLAATDLTQPPEPRGNSRNIHGSTIRPDQPW